MLVAPIQHCNAQTSAIVEYKLLRPVMCKRRSPRIVRNIGKYRQKTAENFRPRAQHSKRALKGAVAALPNRCLANSKRVYKKFTTCKHGHCSSARR